VDNDMHGADRAGRMKTMMRRRHSLVQALAGISMAATAGSAAKCQACEGLGADAAIDYRAQDFVEEVKRLTEGRLADVVLDMVGAPYFARNIRCLKLDGRLVMIAFLNGHVADMMIVVARTAGAAGEQAGLTLFAVPNDAGQTADPRRLVDSSLASHVTFEGVEVDADAVIGDVDGGWAVLAKLLDAGRVGAAAEMIGVGSAAMDMTVDYLKQRKQFGKLIGEFQALQHRAAHLYGEMEVARATVLKAQQLLDAGDPRAEIAVAVAKAKTGKAVRLSVQEGVQMHGGIGMTDEYDIGLYMKRDRALEEFFGDARYHAERVARMSGY
jgi:alkylation response protein AidB-like acyl-CoA dehydrogenase